MLDADTIAYGQFLARWIDEHPTSYPPPTIISLKTARAEADNDEDAALETYDLNYRRPHQ